MVNNFNKAKQFLQFDRPGDYFTIEILLRPKEHPELQYNTIHKTFDITSEEHLDSVESEIIDLCDTINARAHLAIWPNNEEFGILFPKYYVIDIDKEDLENPDFSMDKLKSDLYDMSPIGEKVVLQVPTKSGIHLICTLFNLDEYSKTNRMAVITLPDLYLYSK